MSVSPKIELSQNVGSLVSVCYELASTSEGPHVLAHVSKELGRVARVP
jgi:hypothetical protein